MKLFKWFIPVMVLLIAGGGLYFAKTFDQPDMEQPVKQLSGVDREMTTKEEEPIVGSVNEPLPNLGMQAESVILINAQDGNVFYEKNSDQPLPTASMSKMMTEVLVLEAIDDDTITWGQSVEISDYAYTISNQPGFASVLLNKGQTYTVRALFNAMAIHSANGATIALAEAVSGSEKDFVVRMNDKAGQMGLEHSQFVNSTGLNNTDLGNFYATGAPNDTNIMSANDVALLAQQLIHQYPDILEIVDEPTFTFGQQTYTNTNWMLPEASEQNVSFDGVDGLKTGYTDEAGYCFAGTVKRNDNRFISVVMGTSSKLARFSETKRLYEAAFNQISD